MCCSGAATWPISRTLLADSFIREDGLISIRRSYTVAELTAIAPTGVDRPRGTALAAGAAVGGGQCPIMTC